MLVEEKMNKRRPTPLVGCPDLSLKVYANGGLS